MKNLLISSLVFCAVLISSCKSYATDTNKDAQVNRFQQYKQKVVKHESPLYYMMPLEVNVTGTRDYGFRSGLRREFGDFGEFSEYGNFGDYTEEIQIYNPGTAFRQLFKNEYI